MTHARNRLHRRRFLSGSAASAAWVAVGCKNELQPELQATPERRDVPLRLVLAGTAQDAETIRRGWGAVTEQPIDIQPIELNRAAAASLSRAVLDAAKKSDLVIYPLAWVPQASVAEVVVPLSADEFEEIDKQADGLFPALRSGAARYAGEYLAVPLGAPLPAMLSVNDLPDSSDDQPQTGLASWEAYDEIVAETWDGLAGEPTAPGWAGAMYLWRTADTKGWLFHREDLQPMVKTEPYVRSLELMVRTSARYKTKQQTPDQVWSGVQSADLQGGIGFPRTGTAADGEFQIRDLPGVSELSKVLLDPFSPVISLTASCRQSAAAKRFMQWISGGEGSATVRHQVPGMTGIGNENVSDAQSTSVAGSYDQWLATRLSSPVTLPTLQLLEAGQYYAVLDKQVGRALAGDATPEQALAEVANRWHTITRDVGVAKQLRAWRRAQGIRI